MSDHYQTLGVPRGASQEEIKRAYRKLAAQHHPDRGGDTAKFQDIQTAYSVLSDDQKRGQYDNPGPANFQFEFNGPNGFDFNSIFNMFGAQFQHPHHQGHQRQHTRMSLWVTLADVAQGGRRPVTIGSQHGNMTIEIEIPLGINDGDNVQYSGIGPNNSDLVVNFRIHPNPKWERNGLNLTTEHAISVWTCIVGGELEIQDVLGNQLTLTVPTSTQPGSLLRVKGRGLTTKNKMSGDMFVRIQAKIPNNIDTALIEKIKQEVNK
jgi:curved DNA-binding protein